MPVSKKRLKANRQNAQKSTGPTTEQGKAVASQNSIKHGLYARDIILNNSYIQEDRVEYDLMLESLRDELQPDSIFQDILIQKIANCLWRYRRSIVAETAHLDSRMQSIDDIYSLQELKDSEVNSDQAESYIIELGRHVNLRSIPDDSFSRKLLYYEMRLDRQLTRAYALLKNLQINTKTKNLQNIIHTGKK